MKSILVALLLSFSLASCDQVHSLVFVNETNAEAKVKIILESKARNARFVELAYGDSIASNLKPGDSTSIDFGVGTWSEKEINEISKSIKSIEFGPRNSIKNFNSKDSIKQLLEENKRGTLIGDNIAIKIN